MQKFQQAAQARKKVWAQQASQTEERKRKQEAEKAKQIAMFFIKRSKVKLTESILCPPAANADIHRRKRTWSGARTGTPERRVAQLWLSTGEGV